jgi:uncharacterized membrane protein
MEEDLVPKSPLSGNGKILFGLNILGFIVIWGLGIYAYLSVESMIPTHFNFAGEPDAYGSGEIFLIMPPLLSIAPAIILLITNFRFSLVNKHPYLINLPAFYLYMPKIPLERRGYWFNKYFEAILAVGAFITLEMNLILWGIYISALEEVLPFWFLPLTILMSFIIIPPMIYYFYKIFKGMKKDISQ